MANESIRIGIVGAGGNTINMHIPRLQAIEDVEIVSVCNRSRESGEKVAARFGIPQICDSWHEVVMDDSLDAIVIGTWPYMHHLLSCAALANGKHVMCEARMAMNADEAREMLDTHRAYPELVAQIVPSPFTFLWDAYIQTLIADGYLGDILAADVRGNAAAFVNRDAELSWRQDFDLSGYNTLSMGIWYEALARWIGHAERVLARTKVCVKRRHRGGRPVAVKVPDHVDIIADMICGAQAHLQFSAVTGLNGGLDAWLYGSEGTLYLDAAAKKLMGGRRGDKKMKELKVPKKLQGSWRVEEEFIGAIRGRETIELTSFEEGVKYMEFTEAVALSAANGEAVTLPL